MSSKEKIRCKAIALKIKNGYITFEEAKIEYNLNQEEIDYIETLLNEN